MSKSGAHLFISGKVRGVGFRYSTYHKAIELELTGWVKNTYDKQVEAVFEGDDTAVNKMIEWCKTGPPMSRVNQVEIQKAQYSGEFKEFSIRR